MRFRQFKIDERVRPVTGLDPERLKKIDRITRKLQDDPDLVDEIFKQISTKAKDIEGNFINRFIAMLNPDNTRPEADQAFSNFLRKYAEVISEVESTTEEKFAFIGNLGKKSGQGFYKYSKGKSNGACDVPRNSTFRLQCENEEIVDRLILVMINEAVRCLEEEVVSSPKDVDFGMIMGTGWAPFRGGPIRYLDSIGSKKIAERLQELAKKDAYFTPCDMLLEYAKTNKKFYEEK